MVYSQNQECEIDHTVEDVQAKLEPFLTLEFGSELKESLQQGTFTQVQLNELFHHLKKLHKYQGKINEILTQAK